MRNQSFLKWVGGKNQLLADFQLLSPEFLKKGQCEKYFEPFLGGGSVFFNLASQGVIKKAYLSDVNPELIIAFEQVKTNVEALIRRLREIFSEYNSISYEEKEKMFYRLRIEFNFYRRHLAGRGRSPALRR